MELLERLANGQFVLLYFEVVHKLAHNLSMYHEIEEDLLLQAYDNWALGGFSDRRRPEFESLAESEQILATVCQTLCAGPLVGYRVSHLTGDIARRQRHQAVAAEYAVQYTALELVREQHLELYFAATENVTPLGKLAGLPYMDAERVAEICEKLKTDPLSAAGYREFLGLPPLA